MSLTIILISMEGGAVTYRDFLAVVLVGALAVGLLAGCSDDAQESSASTPSPAVTTTEDALDVIASFYPLQWMAQQVGGGRIAVSSLTPPGAEPHDLELTPTDVAAVADADVVVFLSGFQPAVDEAVEGSESTVFDAAGPADLNLTFTPIEEGVEAADEAGAVDPHFWLDPLRLAAVADAFAVTLGQADPSNADAYTANADRLREELEELDGEFTEGLAGCADENLVTSHNAFGYLAERYGLAQVGITGLTPEEEPSPRDIAAVTDFVEANDVTTIYFETLVSPAIAETIAAETGADTAVLDPIEGLSDESEGADYLEVMRSNLANLRAGQSCS
jgi:zinc transport system substrate-binding protein